MAASPGHAPAPRTVPVWLDRLGALGWRVLVVALFGIVLVASAIMVASVTASILVSLVAVAALAPVLRRLRTRGLSRAVAAALTLATGVAMLAAVAGVVLVVFLPYLETVATEITAGLDAIGSALAAADQPAEVASGIQRLLSALVELGAIDPAAIVDAAVFVGTVAVLALFLTYFLLQDGDLGWAWLVRALPPERGAILTSAAQTGLRNVAGYLGRMAVFAAIDAVVMAAVLWATGLPHVAPLAVLVFVAGFVPYLGAIAAGIVVGLVALAAAGPPAAVLVLTAMLVTSLAEVRLFARTAIGTAAEVNPVLVVVVISVGAAVFGVLGLMTAVPIAIFALALGRPIRDTLDVTREDAGPALPSGGPGPIVPGWLDRLAQWSWRGLVIAALGILAVQLIVRVPGLVVPAVLAIVMAATLRPLSGWLERRGWSRSVAAAGATVGTAVVVGLICVAALGWMVGPLDQVLDTAGDGATAAGVPWLADAVDRLGDAITVDVSGLVAVLFGFALAVALGALLTFLFLRDGPSLWDVLVRRLPEARRARMDEAGDRSVDLVAGYMTGTAIVSLFGAVTTALMMWFLGLPLAIPIGVLTFFAGFIPYIGSFISTALAFLVAVAVGTTQDVIVMAIFTVVFNLLQGSWVAPLVYGRTLSLHPAIVLLAVPVGSAVAGILGMFLVVPFAAIVSASWRLIVQAIEVDDPVAGHRVEVDPGGSTGTPSEPAGLPT